MESGLRCGRRWGGGTLLDATALDPAQVMNIFTIHCHHHESNGSTGAAGLVTLNECNTVGIGWVGQWWVRAIWDVYPLFATPSAARIHMLLVVI